MSYQWKVGELAVCIRVENFPQFFTLGRIYTVRELDDIPDRDGDTGLFFYDAPDHPDKDGIGWNSRFFRPLHGTDIRKLEEKYPEYIIKTNEVEG